MKRNILTAILVASVMCLVAQNHRHNAPYKSESSSIIRMDDIIYQETTTVFVEGLSTTNKVELKVLYTIPQHLRKLDKDVIDEIIRENKPFKTTKLSWFIIWERTYSKDDVHQQFSWKAVKNLLIGYGCILLFFVAIAILIERDVKRGLKQLAKVNPQKDLDKEDRWLFLIYGVLVSVIALFITAYDDNLIGIDILFGFMIYYLVVTGIFYLVIMVAQKFKTNNHEK